MTLASLRKETVMFIDALFYDIVYNSGDMVAKWIPLGTLNLHVAGLSLNLASWLTT